MSDDNINDKLQQIQDELRNLRRLFVMKEICPELMTHIAPPIKLPEGEEDAFVDKFRQEHKWVRDWVNNAYFLLNGVFVHYLSRGKFALEEHLERSKFLIDNDADFLAFFNLMGVLMGSLSKQDFAKDYFDRFIQSSSPERFLPKYYWCRLISYYVERGDEERALNLLFRFRKKFGDAEIADWLPVADLAYRNGSKEYALQASVYQELVKNAKEYSLERLFAHKRIALIGNGPQEKGKGFGEYINSFDFVIRMNSYSLTPEYVKDYGSKCDLRYRIVAESREEETHSVRGNPRYSFLGCPPWFFAYSSDLTRRYAANIESGQILRPYTYPEFRYVTGTCNNGHPSGGLSLITLIHKVNPNFTQSNCFGFSFKEERDKVWSRFDGTVDQHPLHDLTYEKEIIQAMLVP